MPMITDCLKSIIYDSPSPIREPHTCDSTWPSARAFFYWLEGHADCIGYSIITHEALFTINMVETEDKCK